MGMSVGSHHLEVRKLLPRFVQVVVVGLYHRRHHDHHHCGVSVQFELMREWGKRLRALIKNVKDVF